MHFPNPKQLLIQWLFPPHPAALIKDWGILWACTIYSQSVLMRSKNISLLCQLFIKGQKFMEVATGKPYERTPWLARTTVFIFVFHFIIKTMTDMEAWGRSQLLPSCRFDTVKCHQSSQATLVFGHMSGFTYTVSSAMCVLMGVTHCP